MMFELFTVDARAVVVHAQEHARRLGHRYVGCEHLLLAVASTDQPASAVLREQGISPDRVEEEIVRCVGLGGAAGLFSDLDRDAFPPSELTSMRYVPGWRHHSDPTPSPGPP